MTDANSASQQKPCPFCAEPILVQAKKCKHCATVLDATPVTIEQTSKEYKRQILAGVIIFLIGIFVMFIFPVVGFVTMVSGIIVSIVGRMNAWWHHG